MEPLTQIIIIVLFVLFMLGMIAIRVIFWPTREDANQPSIIWDDCEEEE